MKTNRIWKRTLQAMGLGLGATLLVALIAMVIFASIEQMDADDFGRGLFWTFFIGTVAGAFGMAGWLVVVLPLTFIPQIHRWLEHPILTELVWVLLALIAYVVLVITWGGLEWIAAGWIPALMGLFIGLSYRWLGRKGA